jgi:hypothetical protein
MSAAFKRAPKPAAIEIRRLICQRQALRGPAP